MRSRGDHRVDADEAMWWSSVEVMRFGGCVWQTGRPAPPGGRGGGASRPFRLKIMWTCDEVMRRCVQVSGKQVDQRHLAVEVEVFDFHWVSASPEVWPLPFFFSLLASLPPWPCLP